MWEYIIESKLTVRLNILATTGSRPEAFFILLRKEVS